MKARMFILPLLLLFILAGLTLIGTLISDIVLAWADPRIRIEG